jgi:hypothetical protein
MALTAANLRRVAGGTNGIFHYTSADAHATVVASGYFNSVTNNLKNGDVIECYDTNLDLLNTLVVTSADYAATVTTVAASS